MKLISFVGLLTVLLFLYSQDIETQDPKQKIMTPPGVEPENDYNNDYDLLEDDNGDDEEDNGPYSS